MFKYGKIKRRFVVILICMTFSVLYFVTRGPKLPAEKYSGKAINAPVNFVQENNKLINENSNKFARLLNSVEHNPDTLTLNASDIFSSYNSYTGQFPLERFTKGLPRDLIQVLQSLYDENGLFTKFLQKDKDKISKAPTRCDKGYFKLPGMKNCRKLLTCEDINTQLKDYKKLTRGGVKEVYSASLGSVRVIVSRTRMDRLTNEKSVFKTQEGMKNLLSFQPSPYVIQVAGVCMKNGSSSVILTEGCFHYHSMMDFVKRNAFFYLIDARTRFRLAIEIVTAIDFLHRYGKFPRIHCDLHDAYISLSQFLLTDAGHVVLNDLDELPEVDRSRGLSFCNIKPGRYNLKHEFFSPEELITPEEKPYETEIRRLTEKVDIYKVPILTKILLDPGRKSKDLGGEINKRLDNIHTQCRQVDPDKRPNSKEVLIEYLKTYKNVFIDS